MTDDQNPTAENSEHVHDENCRQVIDGFENFGAEEYELTEMLLSICKQPLEDLAWNVLLGEIKMLVTTPHGDDYPVRADLAETYRQTENISPEDQTIATLGYFSGAKATMMTLIAKGFLRIDKVLEALPRPSFPEGLFPPGFVEALQAGRGMVLALSKEERDALLNAEDKDAAMSELVSRKMESGEIPDNPLLRAALAADAVEFAGMKDTTQKDDETGR